ncbi:MAG: hypothetical protein LH616_00825, partial [Ilumatobacteraceae bacterium]|nr:hypothetical protein [Ilumatobacteraceae bacterium]
MNLESSPSPSPLPDRVEVVIVGAGLAGLAAARAVEAAGREIGRGLAPVGTSDSAEDLMRASLTSLGFAPTQTVE